MIDHAGRRTEYTYDSAGQVVSKTGGQKGDKKYERNAKGMIVRAFDAHGQATVFERDSRGHITRVYKPDGSVRDFGYDNLGRVNSFRDKFGGVHQITYDGNGNPASWTNAKGVTTTYHYDQYNHLVESKDSLGNTRSREVNERGLVTKMTKADGTSRRFTYDKYGRKVTETDELGRIMMSTYDSLGRITKQQDVLGGVTAFDYADLPQGCSSCTLGIKASRITDAKGRTSAFFYDSEGRLLSRTVNLATEHQATTTYSYDNDDRIVSATNTDGITVQHSYSKSGLLLETKDNLGYSNKCEYDAANNCTSITDTFGKKTQMMYDGGNRLISVSKPDGSKTTYVYDERGRMVTTVDPLGQTTRFTYDTVNRVAQRTMPDGTMYQYTYDDQDRLAATVYPDGKRSSIEYDLLGRPIKRTTVDGLEMRFTYDPLGRVIAGSDNAGNRFSTSRDSLGRAVAVTDASGRVHRREFDDRDHPAQRVFPDGSTTIEQYDQTDRLVSKSDAGGSMSRYEYSAFGELTRMTDANGNVFEFSLDRGHRVTEIRYPDGSKEQRTIDVFGQTTSQTNRAGQTKHVVYNDQHKPIKKTWTPSGAASEATTIYDELGRVASVKNNNAIIQYDHDVLGRVVRETIDLSPVIPGFSPKTTIYKYTGGTRDGVVYPDGIELTLTHDYVGRLTNVKTAEHPNLAKYTYDKQGRESALDRDNGVKTSFVYEAAGNLHELTHTNRGAVLAACTYTYDLLDRRTGITNEKGISTRLSYDSSNQVVGVAYDRGPKGAAASISYSYDRIGNRRRILESNANGLPNEVRLDTDVMSQYVNTTAAVRDSAGEKTIALTAAYDPNGNLIRWFDAANGIGKTMRYDAENQLIEIESGSERMDLFYDPLGRCVARKTWSRSTGGWALDLKQSRALVYDSAWRLLCEYDFNGNQVGLYYYGEKADDVLMAVLNNDVMYPVTDALGSATALTDKQGNVVERYAYDVFGATTSITNNYESTQSRSGYRFLFTGRELLSIGDIYDFRNRAYLPALGKFLQRDPFRFSSDSSNPTRYVSNNPASFTDPTGLYAADGHYYGTYAVATAQVGTLADDPYMLAYWAQYPDEENDYDAIVAAIRIGVLQDYSFNREIMRTLHSLHGGSGGDVTSWRVCLKNQILTGTGLQMWQRGMLIHALGDAYAHVQLNGTAYGYPLGHAFDGVTPDTPQYIPSKFKVYLADLNEAFGFGSSLAVVADGIGASLADTPFDYNGSDSAARIDAARVYVRDNWGFPFESGYNPEAEPSFNNSLGAAGYEDVRSFLATIHHTCRPCEN